MADLARARTILFSNGPKKVELGDVLVVRVGPTAPHFFSIDTRCKAGVVRGIRRTNRNNLVLDYSSGGPPPSQPAIPGGR